MLSKEIKIDLNKTNNTQLLILRHGKINNNNYSTSKIYKIVQTLTYTYLIINAGSIVTDGLVPSLFISLPMSQTNHASSIPNE